MLHNKKKTKSIQSIVLTLFLAILCPISLVTLLGNYYTKNILQKQAASYSRDTLSVHMQTVDNNLDNLSHSMFLLLYQNINVSLLLDKENSNARIDEQLNIKNTLSNYISAYQSTDGLFFYSPATNDFIINSKLEENIQDRSTLKEYIIHQINSTDSSSILQGNWHPIKINNKYLLIKIIQQEDVYLGSWILADNLTDPLKTLEDDSGTVVFLTDSYNYPLNKTKYLANEQILVNEQALKTSQITDNHKYMIIGVPSLKGNFNLFLSIPYDVIVNKTKLNETILLLVYLLTLILLGISFMLIKNRIIKPMESLKNGMLEIKKGNFNVLLPTPKQTTELVLMTDTFNDMVQEIESLKIRIYEEKLEKSRTHLHYLNLQIKPHFFLNSLNIIYSLALTKDYKLILDMSMCLTNYFRYIFKSSDSMVSIEEELAHINNYLHIHELRFTTHFTANVEIPPQLSQVHIPILLIQTFVENNIKHAYLGNKVLQVDIKVKAVEINTVPYIELMISDNGLGFSSEQLETLNSPVMMKELREEHLGILNIKQRLHLIYDDKANLLFSNNIPNGAVITIRIPQHIQ